MNNRMTLKAIATVIGITVAIGSNMQDKAALSKETKQEMLDICGIDESCIKALNNSFDGCFKTSMDDNILDVGKLADCVNDRAGKDYFAYEYY